MLDSDIVLYPHKGKTALLLLGGLLFVAMCVFLVLTGTSVVVLPYGAFARTSFFVLAVTVFGILFFGYAVVIAIQRLVRPQPLVILNREGITDNASAGAVGLVRWSEIAGIGISNVSRQRFVVVTVNDPEQLLARLPPAKAALVGLNTGLTSAPVNIPELALPMKAEELVRLLNEYYDTYAAQETL